MSSSENQFENKKQFNRSNTDRKKQIKANLSSRNCPSARELRRNQLRPHRHQNHFLDWNQETSPGGEGSKIFQNGKFTEVFCKVPIGKNKTI
uniref:Uncharacterized protein n=1 Tax=Setaria digitata TaxID=48799 RepID=A0A915Q857_9BILA